VYFTVLILMMILEPPQGCVMDDFSMATKPIPAVTSLNQTHFDGFSPLGLGLGIPRFQNTGIWFNFDVSLLSHGCLVCVKSYILG